LGVLSRPQAFFTVRAIGYSDKAPKFSHQRAYLTGNGQGLQHTASQQFQAAIAKEILESLASHQQTSFRFLQTVSPTRWTFSWEPIEEREQQSYDHQKTMMNVFFECKGIAFFDTVPAG
jgi:hypothetical protein